MKDYYTTDSEIEYVRKIGTTHLLAMQIPKHIMLQKYIKACEIRTDWGNLDKSKITAAALLELYSCI